LGALALWVATLVFVVVYYSRLKGVSKEYYEAKDIVERIVMTFKNRYDELSAGLRRLEEKIAQTPLSVSEATEKMTSLNESLQRGIEALETTKGATGKLAGDVERLQKDVESIKEIQSKLVADISEPSQFQAPLSDRRVIQRQSESQQGPITSYVTSTEKAVLDYLLLEGPRTAREIEVKIGKTREHTARLMKKLWQQGYVERETNRIPFTYRASDALHLENSST
jgi:DNA repair exonuclease SbcCD ATPase subunit